MTTPEIAAIETPGHAPSNSVLMITDIDGKMLDEIGKPRWINIFEA